MGVGTCIPISERGTPPRALSYAEMRELAVATEAGGLNSIWVADHLFFEGADGTVRGAWEALAMLGALADATDRVELGPLVLCAPFRNPGRARVPCLRVRIRAQGQPVRGDAVDRRADGARGSSRLRRRQAIGHAELRPPGPREAGPPIMIASSAPRMMSLTARWADRWNTVWYGLPTDEFRTERDALRQACDEIGRDPAEIEVTVGIVVNDPTDSGFRNDDRRLAGDPESIAAGLAAWQSEGVKEVMCRLEPPSVGVVENIARATERFRVP